MKYLYNLVAYLFLICTTAFFFWGIEYATSYRGQHDQVLVFSWIIVFVLISIAFFVLRNKILAKNGGKVLLCILGLLFLGGALGDTVYAGGVVANADQYYYWTTPAKHAAICMGLWCAAGLTNWLGWRKGRQD